MVKISGPADILGVLPHRLGFHPTESLVVVCLEGPRNRDRLVMRFDLPAEECDDALVGLVLERVRAMNATGALLVVYTEQPSTTSSIVADGRDSRRRQPAKIGVVTSAWRRTTQAERQRQVAEPDVRVSRADCRGRH